MSTGKDNAPMRSITVRIDDATLDAIDTFVEERGLLRNRSEVIRAAVEEYATAHKPTPARKGR